MSKRHSPASRIRLVAVGGKLCEAGRKPVVRRTHSVADLKDQRHVVPAGNSQAPSIPPDGGSMNGRSPVLGSQPAKQISHLLVIGANSIHQIRKPHSPPLTHGGEIVHILHSLSQADCSAGGIGNSARMGNHVSMIPKLKPIRTPPRRHFLKEWREEKGYTQTQLADRISALAEKAGLKHDRISKWENHSVGIKEKLIYIIAEALEIETDWLFRHPNEVLREQAILELVGDRSPEAIRAILDIAERLKRLPSS